MYYVEYFFMSRGGRLVKTGQYIESDCPKNAVIDAKAALSKVTIPIVVFRALHIPLAELSLVYAHPMFFN